jgi:hypothetical protein
MRQLFRLEVQDVKLKLTSFDSTTSQRLALRVPWHIKQLVFCLA